ncbi:hypothetical protein Lesp02_14930 [Lentzea sp. NBRC 105346]|uniref:class I adenylate-forming enzyme family protein n=1 Tax=Lentzea sp. NBRC 105346 TaxID=3032205 RepID=UPI0024A29153|nr:class I adenylate-forming enzyme family protein [Lentzea sp. NBRC 105346]GLZ29303.1 hypothetical protein Lesp02_14930 [Lentzea sp. NBRC 105346]
MLSALFDELLRRHGDRVAVSDGETTLTYRELADAVRSARLPIPAVERPRVGLCAGNSTAYVVRYLALLHAGCVPFLIDRATGPQDLDAIVADCGLDLLLHEENVTTFTPHQRPDLHADTEVCRFTSGSTGRPSCIEFSGHAVHRAAVNWVDGTKLTGDDRIACFATLANGLAFNTSLLAAFLVGAQLHLGRGLPTAGRVARMLDGCGATRLVGFPALYESLVRRGQRSLGALRLAISSAAPLSPEVKAAFTELTGVPVHNYYGAAEAGPLTFATEPLTDPGLGRPLPGVSLRAGTPGEPAPIEVRSESMGTRYLNAPGLLESRLTDDGHYRTGDLGYLDGGSLVLTGRTSHMVNVGGRKVDAVEVASVLRDAPGVEDAVVLEVADRHGAPALGAVLAGSPDATEVRRYAATRLAPHQVPALVRTVPLIPRGSTGKPATAQLRRMFETTS